MPDSALKVADKWDSALEQGIKRTAYGTIAGGVLALLLFRRLEACTCVRVRICVESWY